MQIITPKTGAALALAAIVLVGLQMRLTAAIDTVIDTPLRAGADSRDYVSYAYNVKHFSVYSRRTAGAGGVAIPSPDAIRSPGYPIFLMPFLDEGPVRNRQLLHVYIAQAVLSSGIIMLVYLIGRRFLIRAGALGAAALTALSPHLINANAYILSETVFCVLVIAALWVFSRWRPPSGVSIPLLAGMLLGAAAVTRPWIQYLVVVAGGALLLAHGKAKSPRGAAALVVGFAVVFAWWLGRNLVTLGASGDDTLLINGLHHGLYRGFMFEGNPETFGYPYRFDPRAAEISRSLATTLGEILRRFQDDFWSHFAWYTWGKISAVLSWAVVQGVGEIFVYPPLASPYLDNPLFRASKDFMSVLHAPLMVLSVAGAALAWLPVRFLRIPAGGIYTLRAIALLLWYFLAVHCVTAPFPRYAIPMRPISYMLAMFMIGGIVQWSITWVRRKNTTLKGESSA